MKKYRGKIVSILLIILSIVLIGTGTYAHSGRTDGNGGHKDNKNKSGLGSYHYHCGGYPAHLHPNGVCPYSSSSSSSKGSTSSNSSSSKKSTSSGSSSNKGSTKSNSSSSKSNTSTSSSSSNSKTTNKPSTVDVTGIRIDEDINDIEVGESRNLTATITPSNATNKDITWKSSDESIAVVTSEGELIAKKAGTVEITATCSNGKTSTIEISVKDIAETENNAVNNDTHNNIINNEQGVMANNEGDSNPLGIVAVLGLMGVGGYLGYKSYKKSK